MNNVELAKKVEGYLKGSAAKAKKFEDLVAVSISLLSENPEDDMYVTVRDGKILVDHYPYIDNNCAVEASAEIIDKMFSGELAFDKALADGSVQVKSGDPAKLKALECLVPGKKTAKTAKAPKAAAKTAKAPAKAAVKEEPKKAAPAKTAAPAAPVVKEEPKKAAPAAKPAPAKRGRAKKK